MQHFFKDENSLTKAMMLSSSEDGRIYNLCLKNVPLKRENVEAFFKDWPQYNAFPYKNLLLSKSKSEQCDALLSLQEYTVFVDNRAFLF